MNKRAVITFLMLFGLIMTFGGRWLLGRIDMKTRVVEAIAHSFPGRVSIETVTWRWLPAPALSITGLKADSDHTSLSVPRINVILNPTILLTGTISFLRAQLVEPEFTVRTFQPLLPAASATTPPSLLVSKIRIKDGKIHLPGHTLSNGLMIEPVSLAGINGNLSTRSSRGEFTITANPSFAQLIHASGRFDSSTGSYEMDIAAADLDSVRLFNPQSSFGFLPQVSQATFTSHLEGIGVNHVTMRLTTGRDSPFLLQEQDQTIAVQSVDCQVSRHNTNFAVEIKELSLNDPKLQISGRISRQDNETNNRSQRQWLLDLHGSEIDLAGVREALLSRFPTHPIVVKVCGIVRGGSAATARYVFKGGLADFNHLQSMQIWAEAKDVPVLIPGVDLALDRASGPISIIDGRLVGTGLSADIDKSHGKNGDLLVDLRHDHHDFRLDLDLTADLQNLKDVLALVVHSSRFQKELSRFSHPSGMAKGHLHLGDDLRHVKTDVEVVAMTAKGSYDRLPWPFTITSGSLTVAPQQVDWRDIQGEIGNHRIFTAQGKVAWNEGVAINVDSLDADLDLKTLFEQGALVTNSATISLQDLLKERVDTLSGRAKISQTTFSGQLGRKEGWRYHSQASATDLLLVRPNLPPTTSQNAQGEIDQDTARFTGIFSLLDQELFLDGNYSHHQLDHWRGELSLDGDVGPRLGEYIRQNQLIRTAIFPRVPFRFEKFTVTSPALAGQPFSAHGAIISLAQGSQAKAEINIARTPEQISEKVSFLDGPNQGILDYQAWPKQDGRSLLTWHGDLDLTTFDDLFAQQILTQGELHGAFTRLTENHSAVYSGEIQLKDIHFAAESLFPDLSISNLTLNGDSHAMHIDQADLALGDSKVRIEGNFSDEKGQRILDLRLATPHLSSKSLQKAIDYLKGKGHATEPSSLRKSFAGAIRFDIGTFDYRRPLPPDERAQGEEDAHTISIAPAHGVATIRPSSFAIAFDKTRVCGLNANGIWHLGDDTADNEITFSSGTSPIYFEQALPCLGFKQSLIVGPFSAEGEIKGHPHQWKQGSITLTSETGMIKRMNLLSKIFTAVNFTDYFTWQDLPDVDAEGLAYNELAIKGHIAENALTLDRTIIKGKGVNLSGRGTIDLDSYDSDLTFFIAPFKMVDSIITGIPLIGKAIGGPKESILTFPVKVTGNIKSPEVTSLAPEAVGTAAWEMIRDTLTLPFRIFLPSEE